jgi:hypothetical protein
MLIVALVLAVIGLAALVAAVVTSNELIAWVCVGASAIGVLLLIVDAVRERSQQASGDTGDDSDEEPGPAEDYPDELDSEVPVAVEDAEAVESDEAVEADTVAVATDQTDAGDPDSTERH